jgi:cell division protein FtsW
MRARTVGVGIRTEAAVGFDGLLLAIGGTLVAIGLIMTFSASYDTALSWTGDPAYFLRRQMAFLAVGLALAMAVWSAPMRWFSMLAPWCPVLALLLLSIVLVPGLGETVNGSRRWLVLGPVMVQVSELARLLVVIFMAAHLERYATKADLPPVALALPAAVLCAAGWLLLMEPDLGALVVLWSVVAVMLFVAGLRWTHVVFLGLCGLAGLMALVLHSRYRLERLLAFMDPWSDALGHGYQLTHSLMAIGSGGLWGSGIGASMQKLAYLPEAHTDFIYSIFAEETGFVGTMVLMALYVALVLRMVRISRRAMAVGWDFAAYLVMGIAAWFGLQTSINMAVAMGLLPTKGLTMPLVSYGGSSLVTAVMALAVVLRVDRALGLGQGGLFDRG